MKIRLTVTDGPHAGKSFDFDRHDTFIVGRSPDAHFRLPKADRYFSRIHFLVEINPPHCRLIDLGSRNGTYVNSRKVKSADLKNGDVIGGGTTKIAVRIRRDAEESQSELPQSVSVVPGKSAAATKPADRADSTVDESDLPPRRGATRIRTAKPADSRQDVSVPDAPSAPGRDAQTAAGRPPIELPGYQIIEPIGQGGMGVVYRAEHRQTGLAVAVKTIRPQVRVGPSEIDRFLREVQILRKLDHPHIVRFHEMGEAAGQLYFVMDFVPGTDALALLRRRRRPLRIGRAVNIICQALDALGYAHQEGFVHRDFKPANLLVQTEEGRDFVRLTDFGLALAYSSSSMSGLSMTGELAGTIRYMAPEQITNYSRSQPSIDQYAAAATLYRLLTRRYVYDFPRSATGRLLKILEEDPVPITDRRPDLPDKLAAIIHRALARSQSARFRSVSQLRTALLPFADDVAAGER